MKSAIKIIRQGKGIRSVEDRLGPGMTWNSSGILGSMKSLRELPLVVWRDAEEEEKLTCGDREG